MKVTKQKYFWLAPFVALSLAACDTKIAETAPQQASEPVAAAVDEKPTYLVATEANYPPFEFRDENGEIVGYDVDLLSAIGEDQGFKVQFINHAWEGIFDTLDRGERAIVAAGVLVNPERQEKYALSTPYATTPDLAVYLDDKLKLKSFADLKNVSVATQLNTIRVDDLVALKGSDKDVVGTNTMYLALKELAQGKVQAVVGDATVLRYYMQSYVEAAPDLKFHSFEYNTTGTTPEVAFVMKKGNTELQNKVNAGLKNIRANGVYDKINHKWFGEPQAEQAVAASE